MGVDYCCKEKRENDHDLILSKETNLESSITKRSKRSNTLFSVEKKYEKLDSDLKRLLTNKFSKIDNCKLINHLKHEERSKSDSSISNINKIESGYLVTKEDNILVSSIINEMNSCYKD